ncbi:MAG: MotA/TolQ/ExbB proton channel family protein [Elusimicrobia bacterium]|nr:MotA/TolQ/ExbB proton channel family protein [Elusimicrobiota bacterium]
MPQIDYIAVFRDSFTLVILLFCSVISLSFAVERWLYFRKAKIDGDELLGSIRKHLEAGNEKAAQHDCGKHASPVARVLHYGLVNRHLHRKDLDELLATKRLEEKLVLERYLGVLGTMGNIAPFIGLFGTVVGIIKAFRDLAMSGSGGPTVVAKGIAEALVATAGGLAVAIPAVICFNYFMRRVKHINAEMEVYSTRLLVMMGVKA